MTHSPTHSIATLNRLHDRARADAEQLRREALQDFWRGTDQLLLSAFAKARRSADRLASRLARRRQPAAASGCPMQA